jgi:hypothetical protein
MDAHSRELAGAIEGMAETYGRGLVGRSVWFNGPGIEHGRQGVVTAQDLQARTLEVTDDAGERHAISFDNLLPW